MKKNLLTFSLIIYSTSALCMEQKNKMAITSLLNDSNHNVRLTRGKIGWTWKKVVCPKCNAKVEKERLNQHRNTYHRIVFCNHPICRGKKFEGTMNLSNHMNRDHRTALYFFCKNEDCDNKILKTEEDAGEKAREHGRNCLKQLKKKNI